MITGHPSITKLLRDGASLILDIVEERAHIGSLVVDWKSARSYVRRLRHGNQPELARRVVLEFPERSTTVQEEKTNGPTSMRGN